MEDSQRGVKIGVFSDKTTDGPTPPALRGKQIWYSPKLQEYWILDDNRNYINKFYAKKFKQFIDIDAIVFVSPSIKNDMIEEANAVLAGTKKPTASIGDGVSEDVSSGAAAQPSGTFPAQAPSDEFALQSSPDAYATTLQAYQPQQQPYGYQQPFPQQMPGAPIAGYGGGYAGAPAVGAYGGGYGYTVEQMPAAGYDGYGMTEAPYQQELIDDSKKAEIGTERKAKDPSRHLFGFFLTMFILTAVAMIVILFGESIVYNVSALLS